VAAKVAAALDIGLGDGGPERLAATNGTQRILVLLDNCEHVIEAAGSIAFTLIRRTPDVSILATSRERLRISGETVYRLAVLPPATAVVDDVAVRRTVARASRGGAARVR
jgi:non-specific serine/threonine protein kinase